MPQPIPFKLLPIHSYTNLYTIPPHVLYFPDSVITWNFQ